MIFIFIVIKTTTDMCVFNYMYNNILKTVDTEVEIWMSVFLQL